MEAGISFRAAVVAWCGRAILLPHPDRGDVSRLINALVRCGGVRLGGDRAVLDAAGRVRPDASTPEAGATAGGPSADELATASGEPIPVALLLSMTARPGPAWQPERLRGARAVLPLLACHVADSGDPRGLLEATGRLAQSVVTLQGGYRDASVAAPLILAELYATLDRSAAGGSGRSDPKRLLELAEDALASLAEPDAMQSVEEFSGADEAARLGERRFLLLMHWHGRFGNRMHQYAYGATFAHLLGYHFWLPSDWEGTHLFARQHHVLAPGISLRARLNGAGPGPTTPEDRLEMVRAVFPTARIVDPHDPEQNYREPSSPVCFDSLCAYHPSVFDRMSRQRLLRVFEFSDAVKQLDLYKRLEDRQGSYDIAHLRRGDISSVAYNQSNVQGYSVVSKDSYRRAFAEHGYDPNSIEWVSDDTTGQWHADRPETPRGGWRYPQGSRLVSGMIFDWLEDFLRLYFARTIFRANSSFSWWAAFLAPHARVFSPVLHKRHVYGVDGMEEIDVDFVEGNHPHWMYGSKDIFIGE